MRKIIAMLMLLMVLVLTSCSFGGGNQAPEATGDGTETLVVETSTPTNAEQAGPTATTTSTASASDSSNTPVLPVAPVLPGVRGCVIETIDVLHARFGPGMEFARTGYLNKGECTQFLFRSQNGEWVKWEKGWSSVNFLRFDGDYLSLPVAAR